MQNDYFDELIAARFASVERERSDMHGYQVEDCQFFKTNHFAFGLIDLGLGKSVTAGTAVVDLLDEGMRGKVLIVGPIPVISTSWPDEFRTWRHLAPYRMMVLREDDGDPAVAARLRAARKRAKLAGTPPAAAETAERRAIRQDLARSSASIHLISFEGLEWLTEFWGPRWPYRMVVIDESSCLKSHDSERFKALAKVRNTPGLIDRMLLLTATPASESYMGLWAQTFFIDRGQRFGKTIGKFRDEFFTQNRYSFKWTMRSGAEEQILEKLADVATIRKRADYFSTQESMIVQRRITLGAHEMDLYETMRDEAVLTLDNGAEVEAESAAALCQKLSQMASGVLYETTLVEPEGFDPDADELVPVKTVHKIHDHKIEMLRQLVDELDGKNLLVSYQHRSSLDRLKKAFPKAVQWDKTGKSKAPWNAGKIPMMLMHPKSGAHGNNLQKGGHYVVFFDIPWSREQFVQLIGRLDRQGQAHPVTVILLVSSGTIDETIAKAQQDKRDAEDELFRMLKRLISQARKRNIRCAAQRVAA